MNSYDRSSNVQSEFAFYIYSLSVKRLGHSIFLAGRAPPREALHDIFSALFILEECTVLSSGVEIIFTVDNANTL